MLAAAWLMLSSLLYSLQLSTGSFPRPLTAQEEHHYLALSAQGDLEARNILIERNLRLVAHIMKKYYAADADQEDLISIGTIGLIKGITTFDMSKGARLATYAARCIENATLSPGILTYHKNSRERTHHGVRSLLFFVAVSIIASRSFSFCPSGQRSALICWVTAVAWTSAACCASAARPASVLGG
ncbi:MAG: hypothetical protein IJ422_03685 [Oscillospiraceae bacterium]|nr:hypothetical protein [Oscillospiraceae bacterium]